MKRNLLIGTVLLGLTASTFAQGVVTISAASNKIKYTTDGSTLVSVPAGSANNVPTYGGINIAIYSASNGTLLPTNGSGVLGAIPVLTTNNGWYIMQTAPLTTLAPTPGQISSTTVTLNAAAGGASATEQLEVVGWTGNFSSFAAALAAGTGLIGWEGSALIPGGSAFTFSFTTGDGVLSSPTITLGAAGFNGLVLAPVPEPATIVLGGLGAAALLLFRRRK